MLDLMRKHAGTWMIKVILGAIIIVFMFWGIGSYSMREGMRVAVVNGTTISVEQYRDTYNRLLDQLRQRFGNNLNDEMLQMFNVRRQALDSVIDQALLLNEAKRLQIRVTDQELSEVIQNTPAFQSDGRFDPERYRRLLAANRLTPETFEADQRSSMIIGKLRALVSGSVNVSETEVKAWYNWNNASMDMEYVLFSPDRYADIEPVDGEIETYFEAHKDAYKTDPMIRARYIKFSPSDYLEGVSVGEEEIQEYYETHPEAFRKAETIEARHILIQTAAEDSPEQVEAARIRALDVLKIVRDGEDFAEAAKKYSEGPSKDNGGYLGAFEKDAMVAPFSEQAFAMEAGQISEPVKTQFGWHIIKVEKVNPAVTVPLEEATASIRRKLGDEQAKVKAFDKAEALYEAAYGVENLAEVAAKQDVTVVTTDLFSKTGTGLDMKNASDFAGAAFGLNAGEVGDITELGGDYFIIQVVEEVPEKIPALEAVADRVRQDLLLEKQREKAKADGLAFLDALRGGQSMEEAGQQFGVKPEPTGWFKRNEAIPPIGYEPAFMEAAFKLSEENPLPESVIEGNGGYFIARFKERRLPDEEGFGKEQQALEQQLRRQKELEAFTALVADLKQRGNIDISEEFRQ